MVSKEVVWKKKIVIKAEEQNSFGTFLSGCYKALKYE